MTFPIYGKINFMIQTTNQIGYMDEYGTMVGFYSHSYGLEWKVWTLLCCFFLKQMETMGNMVGFP
jgi:hypothetical protein